MNVLIVEDDQQTANLLLQGLADSNIIASHANDGLKALETVNKGFDAIICDLMMPNMDGLTFIKHLRKRGFNTPVLILSAKNSVDERIIGLDNGGDDYLVKPFAFAEVLARIQALVRRQAPKQALSILKVHDLELDIVKMKVLRAGKELNLQPREIRLLHYMIRNEGKTLTRSMLLREVWDFDFDPGTNIVESSLCRLREKIDKPHSVKLLHTIRSSGYVLERK